MGLVKRTHCRTIRPLQEMGIAVMLTKEQQQQIDDALELAASVFGKPDTTLLNRMDVSRFLRLRCCDKKNEEFGVIWMDARYNVISVETLGLGSVDYVEIPPRRIVTSCMEANACHAILFHNHPSGESSPSHQDEIATDKWGELLELVGCRLLDHMVVGRDVYSICEDKVIR